MHKERWPCDWGTLTLSDIARLGMCLREAVKASTSLADRAQLITKLLFESFIARQSGLPVCPLIRVFRTRPSAGLSAEERSHLDGVYGAGTSLDVSSVVELIGSYGLQPAWCDPQRSIRFRYIPLGGESYSVQFPMIHEIVRRVESSNAERDVETLGPAIPPAVMYEELFYVPDAVGSPHIPVQAEFVVPYGIRSVIGFGGRLTDGNVFCVVLFSCSAIPAHVLPYMRMLSMNVRLALERDEERGEGGAGAPVWQGRDSRHAVFEDLMQLYEDTIVSQHESLLEYLGRMRQQREEIEEHAGRVQALNRQLLTAAEEERRKLSRDLHDVVATQLGGMVFQMQAVLDGPPAESMELRRWIQQYRTALLDLVQRTRTLAFELHPASLGRAGVIVAVERLLQEAGQRQQWQTKSSCDEAVERLLSYEESVCVYRVAQEAIHNSEKHAKALCVEVRLTAQGDEFVLEVVDDGTGFHPGLRGGQLGEAGLGLLGMEERARIINGELTVQSSQTTGTRVRLAIARRGR